MSESEVSQIRDEDVLRRMWQQTEDFSRKKEIRAHMYRLREERLRNLYSPEPPTHDGKGCEFTSAQGHVKSFADQTFQSMKSKEVRDAGSPPKEFTYRGQDLKELSNAGWNVESENRTTDDGRTHVKSVNANIEGRYDVDGGRGQFAAVDHQRQAVTEYQDDNSSLRRDETSSDTAAHEHVVRQTDDGTHYSSTTSSSNTSSKIQQVSSTKHETVPYVTDDDYDLPRRTSQDTNRNEQNTRITNKNEYEQTLRRNDFDNAELVSRKVEYPDSNTKVIVETRCLPDGTRVTSTRREFRAPAQSTRSESYQTKSESKSYSSQHKSDTRDSSTKVTRHTIDNRTNDIVDSQRNVDDSDFKKQIRQYTVYDNDDYSNTQQRHVKTDRKISDFSKTDNDYSQTHYETRINKKVIDHSTTNKDDNMQSQHHVVDQRNDKKVDESERRHVIRTTDHDIHDNVVKDVHQVNDTKERVHNITMDRKQIETKISDTTTEDSRNIEEIRNMPRDVNVTYDRIRDIPKDVRDDDIPRDSHNVKDTPRNRDVKSPLNRNRDVPKAVNVHDIPRNKKINEEHIHNITRDTKVEDVVERKTSSEHYQTTYQNDFQTRKISTDWSPTHQAWASTLRSDTPSTTRPSTRASSPGSRTFNSSTSSLRSSVSPDKASRKPSSRGGSPNKLDRYSPTRTIAADRYSSTHSTQSVNEVRINKNTSPERKPPSGRTPGRPGYSPDRKPQDIQRQRPSVSPEKRPQNFGEKPNASPERKPSQKPIPTDGHPKGFSTTIKSDTPRSPAGPRQSPDRNQNFKPSDDYPGASSPHRSTTSPQRQPTYEYPNRNSPRSTPSPDRKLGHDKPTNVFSNPPVLVSTPSPGKKMVSKKPTNQPTDANPDHFAPRSSQSPDRKQGYKNPSDSYPNDSAPRSSLSLDRKPGHNESIDTPVESGKSPVKTPVYQQSNTEKGVPDEKYPADTIRNRPSVSPDRRPSYMKPTGASQPDTRRPSKPTDELDKKSPTKQGPHHSTERKPNDVNKSITNVKNDHYRFVDEETKTYTQVDNRDTNIKITKPLTPSDNRPNDKNTTVTDMPSENSPDFCTSPKKDKKSPSPGKPIINDNENDDLNGRVHKTVEKINTTIKQIQDKSQDITSIKTTPKDEESPNIRDTPSRETSPSKYGTYDKKKPSDVINTKASTITTKDTKEVKYDSLTRRDKTLVSDLPSSPNKRSPRDSTSPLKSPTKDTKYKQTTDFLASEKTTEETIKKTTTKDHPRQLVTPSSSPTRKPKKTETEPSTGQSSPTTSVSGFVYFGSPRSERPMVTDLDEFYPDSENPDGSLTKRPKTLDVKRSPSPSKIPCRSPSPDKSIPASKDSLPRKSSLKKPATDVNQGSPLEKPPTSFHVSPTDEKSGLTGHNVVNKDHPREPTDKPEVGKPNLTSKVKPPLQRRETYEDRCKKILGMIDDTTTSESLTKETTRYKKRADSNQSSPSVSPCDSPVPKEPLPFSDYPAKKKGIDTKVDVTDFITREQEHVVNTTITRDSKAKTPSRESSPTKLQDIARKTTLTTNKTTKEVDKDTVTRNTTTKHSSFRQSPDKSGNKPSEADDNNPRDLPKDKLQKRPSESPERKPSGKLPTTATVDQPEDSTTTKPSRLYSNSPSRSSLSPERISVDKNPKEASPQRQSPEKSYGYSKTTKSVTSRHNTTSTDDVQESTRATKSSEKFQPTRVLESPTRQILKSTLDQPEKSTEYPRPTPPSRSSPKQGSPARESATDKPSNNKLNVDDSKPGDRAHNEPDEDSDNTPGYMKSTTAVTSKFGSTTTEDHIRETYNSKSRAKKEPSTSSLSPTRKTFQDTPRSTSPTKHSQPSENSPKRSDSSPQRKPTKGTTTKHPKSTAEHPRTPSPIKQTRPSDIDLEGKPGKYQQPASPKRPSESSPIRTGLVKTPGYKTTTVTTISKSGTVEYDSENIQELITSKNVGKNVPVPRDTKSPTRKTHKPSDEPIPEYHRTTSPERKPDNQNPVTSGPIRKPVGKHPQSPKSESPAKSPGYMKITTSATHKFDTSSTTKDIDVNTSISNMHKTNTSPHSELPNPKATNKTPRISAASPERRPGMKLPGKEDSMPGTEHPKETTPVRSSISPDRPSYMKPTESMISKFDTVSISSENAQQTVTIEQNRPLPKRSRESPTRESPEREPKDNLKYENLSKPEEPRQLSTPSPIKKVTKITEVNKDFIISEREQEILNKVQKSLRKLSPERKEKSPSRERSPAKSTTSLQDLDIMTSETVDQLNNENLSEIVEEKITITSQVVRPGKPNQLHENKSPSKPSSRNVSPTKKTTPITPNKMDKTPESPTKTRSISPKKPMMQVERPQSPQVPKSSGIKPREQIAVHLTRKPTPATLSPTKIERLNTETKKTNGATKQNLFVKTTTPKTVSKSIPSPTGKFNEPESKRAPTPKGLKDNVSPKKDVVSRTTSDINIKPKKTSSPQRIKSKPEIQVSDMSTKSPKSQKSTIKEPHNMKLPNKPKSATALNTSTDDDDIIIDVQQSKSSRENSPDRICPTPINFSDDVGTPRFPDEVNEPDDDFVKRTYHTIHETETVVDDIVEICEDEELFVKKSNKNLISEGDDSLLSVNAKVNKFTNKIQSVTKPKDTTTSFKDTERRVHSDFIDENLKSDECLLTVSEKVNKFAKGSRDTNDRRSPSRKITDEYDRDTVYQDDYTKLSVNDKAHLFVETAENVKVTKVKPVQKVERPDLSNVDESLKSDDCLLSVSDKVSKFVKTAEHFLTETQTVEDTDKKIKEQHEKIMKQIVDDDEDDDETFERHEIINLQEIDEKPRGGLEDKNTFSNESKPSHPKVKDYSSPKQTERTPTVKITTLRSSEAVKKAKALFENIATTQKIKDVTHTTKTTTKLTDIGVIKKSPKTESTLHPSAEEVPHNIMDVDSEVDAPLSTKGRPSSGTLNKPQYTRVDEKPRSSPNRLTAESPEVARSKSPIRQRVEVTTTKTIMSRYPASTGAESPRNRPESPMQRTESPRQRTESPMQRTESPRHRPESDKLDKVPGYLRPTKTSQIKEEPKIVDEPEVSSRRGSGKFGVELRRTSVERSTVSSERRRSVEHHQPCIEDIFDLDLLEQMLEKVMGYEQRRRIRAQIRVARNQSEHVDTNTYTKTTKITTSAPKPMSPDRQSARSPERTPKTTPQKTSSPDRHGKSTPHKTMPDRSQLKESITPVMNGHAKDPAKSPTTRQRPRSPEKPASKSTLAPKMPIRQPSPDKRRPASPSKVTPKSKSNRFNEYASAYMKKVGLNESDKIKFTQAKTKKTTDARKKLKHEKENIVQEFSTTKTFTERTSSKDVIEIVHLNGKRSPSPEKRKSPERKAQASDRKPQSVERKAHSPERQGQSPDRIYQRTPSPDFKRPKADGVKETIIKTVYDIQKKIPSKQVQEEKPSWVTNRNLKKITTESRTYSSKKIESEKPKYRAASPSKVISKPIDVITSSYGPGPLDANGKPLFGIKALRNGASNFQVKGTVIRQEFHSRNGGEPEGTVSVTAYSSQPEELEQLLAAQGAEPPSKIHGLAAITTTKKFGGETGNSFSNVHTKEERASLEQFTHTDRKIDSRVDNLETRTDARVEDNSNTRRIDSRRDDRQTDKTMKREEKTEIKRGKVEERRERVEKREDKKTVRQSSVKSLTEKYIKSANDSGKSDRTSYPKAGLILRTTSMRDSVSSDDAHPGLTRTDSEHSLGSAEDTVVTTTQRSGDGVRTTTTRTTHHGPTITQTRSSTVSHEPVITKKTSTVITQEPIITKKTTFITQEPVVTHRVISQEPTITHKVIHEPVKVTQRQGTTTVTTERSFLDSNSKVTGVQDILTRMKNADIVIQDGDTEEDSEARALLNKFLGATVLMAGMQGYVAEQPEGRVTVRQETVRSTGSGGKVTTSHSLEDFDPDHCWDERLLKKLLDECTDYEQRRRLRARIRTLMAEQEACASAVTEALGAAGVSDGDGGEAREEEEVTVTTSVRRDSSDKTVSSSTTTTKSSKVIEMTRPAPKPVSPFAKFRQLEKQNSTNSPNSPKTPQSPGSPSQPYFKFTDPALQCSALTIKERLLQWCRDKTRDYENVKLENFSTSWADGLAFCALVHHFLPNTFDYSKLTPDRRRHNFTLAFKVADEKAGIYPLLDVDDMVAMRKPDWKCVFTYVQAIYRRFKDQD